MVLAIVSIVVSIAMAVMAQTRSAGPGWPGFGGPQRNFKASSTGIASTWPAAGPRQLWNRALGAGHSSVVVEQDRLYTMYSSGGREFVVAMDAASGKTVWEHSYAFSASGLELENGDGPHSTPLISGSLLFSVGTSGQMFALDKKTGRVVWSKDLWNDLGGNRDGRGYACSPLAYGNNVIVTVGGKEKLLVAFNQQDGKIAWRNLDFTQSPSSPLIANIGGQDQLILFAAKEILGADPMNGNLLWSVPHKTSYGLNISLPVVGNDNRIFISSAYGTGSRGIELTRNGNQTIAKEAWKNSRVRFHFGTAIRVGDYVYGSSGDFGPAFFTAINAKTGQVAWQDRSLPRASFVFADGKFILVDEDGTLALATAFPGGLNIEARASVLKNRAWTGPTLVGTRLYVRDRQRIIAFDLS
jgi:outer membrane protein assembly factor BamB